MKIKAIVVGILAALTVVAGGNSLVAGMAIASAAPATMVASSVDDSKKSVCEGIGLTGSSCNNQGTDLNDIVRTVVTILSFVAGILAVIMIIIAGLRYITSGGDATKVSGAKSALIYAVVGLVVVALSQIIVHFVLNNVG